jgi:hypothetical protein
VRDETVEVIGEHGFQPLAQAPAQLFGAKRCRAIRPMGWGWLAGKAGQAGRHDDRSALAVTLKSIAGDHQNGLRGSGMILTGSGLSTDHRTGMIAAVKSFRSRAS